jgi:hypothetical protein
MNLQQLHAERRRLLHEIIGAERTGQVEIARHLLVDFQKINHQVRDLEEYHPMDVKHDMAMAEA